MSTPQGKNPRFNPQRRTARRAILSGNIHSGPSVSEKKRVCLDNHTKKLAAHIRKGNRKHLLRVMLMTGIGMTGTAATLLIQDKELGQKVREAIFAASVTGLSLLTWPSVAKQQRGKEVEEITRALQEEARRNKEFLEVASNYTYVALNSKGEVRGTNHPRYALLLKNALVIPCQTILAKSK